MPNVVVFDLGGVVFRWNPAPRLATFSLASPLSSLDIDAALWGSGFSQDADRGLYDAQAQFRETQMRARVAMDYRSVREAWVSAFEPDPAVVVLLGRVAPEVTCASFSNNSELLRFAFEAKWPEIMAYFKPSVWSHELRASKPKPEAYRMAAARLRAEPADILFIDDSEENIEAAHAEGWHTFRYSGDDAALESALDAQGLLTARA